MLQYTKEEIIHMNVYQTEDYLRSQLYYVTNEGKQDVKRHQHLQTLFPKGTFNVRVFLQTVIDSLPPSTRVPGQRNCLPPKIENDDSFTDGEQEACAEAPEETHVPGPSNCLPPQIKDDGSSAPDSEQGACSLNWYQHQDQLEFARLQIEEEENGATDGKREN